MHPNTWTVSEQNQQSEVLAHINLNSLILVDVMREGEKSIPSQERLQRVRELGHIPLDMQAGYTFFHNEECMRWLNQQDARHVDFVGTVLSAPPEFRGCIFSICKREDDSWYPTNIDLYFHAFAKRPCLCVKANH